MSDARQTGSLPSGSVDNVVLLIADTVRWDFLGYNGGATHTPNLDRLAARSTIFARHHAASFPTVPARYDFLTGKLNFTSVGWSPLPHDEYVFASDLSAAGLTTFGVVDTPFYQNRGFYYERGFDYFYDMQTQPVGAKEYFLGDPNAEARARNDPLHGQLIPEPRLSEEDHAAPQTIRRAEACLERLYTNPFFALVDTWDPHEPWDAPEYYVARYVANYAGERVHPPYSYWRDEGLTERDIEIARGNYAGKLEMVDRWIGHFLDKLERLGVADRTAIVFTSDHGHYLGEHGLLGKMVQTIPGAAEERWLRSPLYEDVTHVPLIVHIPGEKPRICTELTSALDIAPTILTLAGLEPKEHMLGRSLVPAALGDAFTGHDVVVTAMPLASVGDQVDVVDDVTRVVDEWQPASVTDGDWTLLYAREGDPVELYDLRDDPRQELDRSAQHPDVVLRLAQAYLQMLRAVGAFESDIAARFSDE